MCKVPVDIRNKTMPSVTSIFKCPNCHGTVVHVHTWVIQDSGSERESFTGSELCVH